MIARIIMWIKSLYKCVLWILFFSLVSCVADDEEVMPNDGLAVGDKVPHFSIVMNDGKKIEDKDLQGSISLIVFFNTSCKDCQQELPVLQRFYESYPEYPLICISRKENMESVSQYWAKEAFTMPYSAQDDTTIYQLFARQRIPRIYVIDAEGVITHIFTDNPLASLDDLVKAVTSDRTQ